MRKRKPYENPEQYSPTRPPKARKPTVKGGRQKRRLPDQDSQGGNDGHFNLEREFIRRIHGG